MELTTLRYETGDDGVAALTISRPEAMNSLTPVLCDEMAQVWSAVRDDDAVRAVVLDAAPGRAFSTGVDVKEAVPWPWPPMVWDRVDPFTKVGPKHNGVWKPVVCAVHGMVSGAGWYFLNEADVVICSDDAQFFDSHLTFGMVAAVEPIGMLATVPFREIMRMVLLGNDERISAQTAKRIGIATEVTTGDELRPRARELAALIAAKSPTAVQGTVRALWEALDLGRRAAIDRSLDYVTIGNQIAMKEVDRTSVPKRAWNLR